MPVVSLAGAAWGAELAQPHLGRVSASLAADSAGGGKQLLYRHLQLYG